MPRYVFDVANELVGEYGVTERYGFTPYKAARFRDNVIDYLVRNWAEPYGLLFVMSKSWYQENSDERRAADRRIRELMPKPALSYRIRTRLARGRV